MSLQSAVAPASGSADKTTEQLLAELRIRTGLDVSGYRRATVERRISNRMMAVGTACRAEYLELLRGSADEAERLLERITIKVSRFYRNPQVFDAVAALLPELYSSCAHTQLRVWSAGCGRGEEAWTAAMLLRDSCTPGSVMATDVDANALRDGNRGVYRVDGLRDLPLRLRAEYLHHTGSDAWQISETLRPCVQFGLHDLTRSAAPAVFETFDLIFCRNVLIYFDEPTQQHALRVLHRALSPNGILCLGEAEWPMQGAGRLFRTLSSSHRLFARVDADA